MFSSLTSIDYQMFLLLCLQCCWYARQCHFPALKGEIRLTILVRNLLKGGEMHYCLYVSLFNHSSRSQYVTILIFETTKRWSLPTFAFVMTLTSLTMSDLIAITYSISCCTVPLGASTFSWFAFGRKCSWFKTYFLKRIRWSFAPSGSSPLIPCYLFLFRLFVFGLLWH